MFETSELHTDIHVFDNKAQDDVIHRLYAGMADGYVPFDDDEDSFGYDYESVIDAA